ncbi:LysR family transcriptional regulator [Mycobacterium yunnanensis]|uniref:LysR family transcriptional regulator n=1 Tax=Mycobacterium yunnanensis TaxID=368477 RepID=A0A9X3C2U7_9MYCO|nr:LysR family transcriptional regulator [Mycobacterium yunnanensis]MCV7420967.1 LysR family transcriptional regulator [Mycobacterium yunnanensis]
MPLSSRMPDLAEFEVILAIAETGSIGAAAKNVGLTQQAVSARLASMEGRIGVQLAVRTPRGSQLTPAGVVVAEWAHQLLDVAHHVDAGLASLRSDARTHLVISASQTVAEQLLPRWLMSLRASAARLGTPVPELTLTATNSSHAVADVESGTADVGFVESPTAPGRVRSRIVAADELVVVVAPDHEWARRPRPVSAAKLARTPLISRESGSGTRDSLTAALKRAGCDPAEQAPPALELSSAAAVRAAVLAGQAPAVMSRLSIADDLAFGRLREVSTPELDLRRHLRAIWLGVRAPPAGAVRDLLGHIQTMQRLQRGTAGA